MGTSGIVGPCILQAAGAGYSFKLLKTRPRGRGVLRRWRGEQRRVPRGAEHGQHLEAAGAVRLREQPVRHRGAVRATPRATRASRSRGAAYGMPGRRSGRQRRAGGVRGGRRGGAARPGRRRPDAARVQDLPHPPARRRHGRLTPTARARKSRTGSERCPIKRLRARAARDEAGDRGRTRRDRRGSSGRRSTAASAVAEAGSVARPGDGDDARLSRAQPTATVQPTPPAPASRRRAKSPSCRPRSRRSTDEMARNPRHLRAGRRHRQARRQLRHHGRAVRPSTAPSGSATRRSASAASSAWAAARR